MTTSPASGLSPEAKEFVPLTQNPPPSIPLYVDENTVASIYSSDQQPIMVQAIYPMMISNSKATDHLQFPEIEFHIQPSQQQQFHIDSCTNMQSTSSSSAASNGNASSTNTSQIVLLPTSSNSATGYYPTAPILYANNEPVPAFYPIDYCEQPLINFSLQHPSHLNKSNRISSQPLHRPSSFRHPYGSNHSSYRPSARGGSRGNANSNRNNPYYDYNNRRNCSSYPANSSRGNASNSKRISSSYHPHEYNNYYHSSSRSRGGYFSRSSQAHDDQHRKDQLDYYNHEKDFYDQEYPTVTQMNDDGTPFEFRPEDFPSLPMNNSQTDKTPSPSTLPSNNTKATSSWNAIVSAPRPHSTSPHSLPPSQDQRSDRSRSFNTKLTSTNERKSSNKKAIPPASSVATKGKSPTRASKLISPDDQQPSQSITNHLSSPIDSTDSKDDGFIQTKHQHRRLKRKNKLKEESNSLHDSTALFENDNPSSTVPKSDFESSVSDQFKTLTTEENENPSGSAIATMKTESKREVGKTRKPTKIKAEEKNETDINTTATTTNDENCTRLSPSSSTSSDTSDYDDAVDNFDEE